MQSTENHGWFCEDLVVVTLKKWATSCDSSGFTLLELITTLSIFMLLTVMSVPAFRTMQLNSRMLASANTLASALNYARSLALSQNSNILICPYSQDNSITCGSNWSAGWITVSQPVVGSPILLQSYTASELDPALSASVTTVVFDGHGLATTQANFKLCDTRGGPYAQSVQVLQTGYIQIGSTPGTAVWNDGALICP